MSQLTSERARLLGRLGAYARWSRESDRTAATAPARAALRERWVREIEAEAAARGEALSPGHLAERVQARQLEAMARLRLAAHDARQRRAMDAGQHHGPAGGAA